MRVDGEKTGENREKREKREKKSERKERKETEKSQQSSGLPFTLTRLVTHLSLLGLPQLLNQLHLLRLHVRDL